MTTTKIMTFAEMETAEPELGKLRRMAELIAEQPQSPFCANEVWYRLFKPRLVGVVGWDRDDGPDWLQTTGAYDLATETLYDLLPNCDHEGMCW